MASTLTNGEKNHVNHKKGAASGKVRVYDINVVNHNT